MARVRGEILREGYRTHDLRSAMTEARQRAADLRLERAALLPYALLLTITGTLGWGLLVLVRRAGRE